VDDVYSALTLAFNSFKWYIIILYRLITIDAPPKQTVLTNHETAIQGHSMSFIVVPIDAAYMTSYYSIVT